MRVGVMGVDRSMPAEKYHAHPALSSTGARRLLPPSCPALYRWEQLHPTPPTAAMRMGTAMHREVLGVGSDIEVSDEWTSYRTKDAQAWRDAVSAAGQIPMLAHEYEPVAAMRDALRADPVVGALFDPDRGDAEVSLFWTDRETGVDCRARLDFLPHPVEGRRLIVPDYKTCRSAEPAAFGRAAADMGYALQADFYMRGVVAAGLDPAPAFVFVAQEKTPPYLVQPVQLSRDVLALAHRMNTAAMRRYATCVETDTWPGYAPGVAEAPLPTWWSHATEDFLDNEEE